MIWVVVASVVAAAVVVVVIPCMPHPIDVVADQGVE
jgi:hypothetical protein